LESLEELIDSRIENTQLRQKFEEVLKSNEEHARLHHQEIE